MTMDQFYLVELLARADHMILNTFPRGSHQANLLWTEWADFLRRYHKDPDSGACYQAAIIVMDLVRAELRS